MANCKGNWDRTCAGILERAAWSLLSTCMTRIGHNWNPPTPPGSTGCESASGFPPCAPHLRFQVHGPVMGGASPGSPPAVICNGSAALGLDPLCGHGFVKLAAISNASVKNICQSRSNKQCSSQNKTYDIGTNKFLLQ